MNHWIELGDVFQRNELMFVRLYIFRLGDRVDNRMDSQPVYLLLVEVALTPLCLRVIAPHGLIIRLK